MKEEENLFLQLPIEIHWKIHSCMDFENKRRFSQVCKFFSQYFNTREYKEEFIRFSMGKKWKWIEKNMEQDIENILVYKEFLVIGRRDGISFYFNEEFVYHYPLQNPGNWEFTMRGSKLIAINKGCYPAYFLRFDLENANKQNGWHSLRNPEISHIPDFFKLYKITDQKAFFHRELNYHGVFWIDLMDKDLQGNFDITGKIFFANDHYVVFQQGQNFNIACISSDKKTTYKSLTPNRIINNVFVIIQIEGDRLYLSERIPRQGKIEIYDITDTKGKLLKTFDEFPHLDKMYVSGQYMLIKSFGNQTNDSTMELYDMDLNKKETIYQSNLKDSICFFYPDGNYLFIIEKSPGIVLTENELLTCSIHVLDAKTMKLIGHGELSMSVSNIMREKPVIFMEKGQLFFTNRYKNFFVCSFKGPNLEEEKKNELSMHKPKFGS
jgi:hypothetical protein